MKKIYDWDNCPNIDLRDKRVVWWGEEEICVEEEGERVVNGQTDIRIICKACGIEDKVNEHHIIPQFMESSNQKRIILCEKHHQILHNMLNQVIWKNKLASQDILEEKIAAFTNWFCKHKWVGIHPENKRDFLKNHCILCKKECWFKWWDYESSMGLFGLCEDCNDWEEREYQRFILKNEVEEWTS